jgi:hypothetical protein
MPTSSFVCLFGDADGLLGSVFLDSAAPTLSAASLHRLVVTLGLIQISQAKATYGHWRTKMQCKSDPSLHHWKSPANLPAYLSSQFKALNPTPLTLLKSRIDILLPYSVPSLLAASSLSLLNSSTLPMHLVLQALQSLRWSQPLPWPTLGSNPRTSLPVFFMRTCGFRLSWSLYNHSSIPRSRAVRCLLPLNDSLVLLRLKLLNSISRMRALYFSPLGNSSVEPLTMIKLGVHTAVSSSRKSALLNLV